MTNAMKPHARAKDSTAGSYTLVSASSNTSATLVMTVPETAIPQRSHSGSAKATSSGTSPPTVSAMYWRPSYM